MFALLYDPLAEIKKSKQQSYAKILMYLVTAALFETIGLLFFAWRYFGDTIDTGLLVNGVVFVLFSLIILHLVVALFYSMAMHVLDGKGGYYEGLTTLVLAMVAPALATFFGGAISFIPYGIMLSALLLGYGYVVGAATLFRSGKELFHLDYSGVLVGFLITVVPLALIGCAFILL